LKILLISYEPPDINKIRGWDTWCAYFLDKAFRSKGHEVINVCFKKDIEIPYIPEIDFIVCVTRIKYLIDNHGMKLIDLLKTRSKNKICSYGDIVNNNLIGQTIFSVLCNKDDIKNKYYKIWWCGDNEYLYPEHSFDKYYILLDHIHYSNPKYDYIFDLYRQGLEELSHKYPLEVKIIADPNVVDFDLKKNKNYPYTRSKNRWLDIIPYYRKTHIYCVTHLELGGLSVMETAWCGANVIIPDSYICHKLSDEVNSYHCNPNDYKSIRDNIEKSIVGYNVEKNIMISRRYTWDDVVNKIVNIMLK